MGTRITLREFIEAIQREELWESLFVMSEKDLNAELRRQGIDPKEVERNFETVLKICRSHTTN